MKNINEMKSNNAANVSKSNLQPMWHSIWCDITSPSAPDEGAICVLIRMLLLFILRMHMLTQSLFINMGMALTAALPWLFRRLRGGHALPMRRVMKALLKEGYHPVIDGDSICIKEGGQMSRITILKDGRLSYFRDYILDPDNQSISIFVRAAGIASSQLEGADVCVCSSGDDYVLHFSTEMPAARMRNLRRFLSLAPSILNKAAEKQQEILNAIISKENSARQPRRIGFMHADGTIR